MFGYVEAKKSELKMREFYKYKAYYCGLCKVLKEKYGFYTQQAVPAGTYNGMEEDVMTVAVMATYIVDKDLPEDTVYDITKAIFENKDAIAKVHVKGEELDVANATADIPKEVPIHPGALKYFNEVAEKAE